ncbi:hypothetical protein F4678DRAFT_461436 [Xylaria arbuscula]|nr:hypothetical protein F4678DRAFT_461436 [Xylaria arbuscula]
MADRGYNYGYQPDTGYHGEISSGQGYSNYPPDAGYTATGGPSASTYADTSGEYPNVRYAPGMQEVSISTGTTAYDRSAAMGHDVTAVTGNRIPTEPLGYHNYSGTTGNYTSPGAGRHAYGETRGHTRETSQRENFPHSPEDRRFEHGQVQNPRFWQGQPAESTWNYVQSGAPTKGEHEEVSSAGRGNMELDDERADNMMMEEGIDIDDMNDRFLKSGKHYKSGKHHHKHGKHHDKSGKHHDEHETYHKHDKHHKHHKRGRDDSPERGHRHGISH